MKVSHGCWTCRLRRKKCDEGKPICGACATLDIKCHYQQQNKPEWMDGGRKQANMAEQIKREIKLKARQRRGEPVFQVSDDFRNSFGVSANATPDLYESTMTSHTNTTGSSAHEFGHCPQQELQPKRDSPSTYESRAFRGSDAVLCLFYLEKVIPFIFPFYNPNILEGGKGWLLEMFLTRPAVRQAILCQSSYFSFVCGTAIGDVYWDDMLAQTNNAYLTLRKSLEMIDGLDIGKNLGCTVRIIASIMQVYRFEITMSNFDNWQKHLNAVISVFKQFLDTDSNFNAIMDRLGPQDVLLTQSIGIPNAEQAALRFSSALVIFDDIIASTVFQRRPQLLNHHLSLLCNGIEGHNPPVNIEPVLGIQNWVMVQIAEIAALDAWKLDCRKAGNLDVIKLAHRAMIIKKSLSSRLADLENTSTNGIVTSPKVFAPSNLGTSHRSLITRIWAYAALLYLFIVTSGWQPANDNVRDHVSRILELLSSSILTPALLRTVVWPFCVAGCLAQPAQETRFRHMMEGLNPPSLFGCLHKAFETMKNAWQNRNRGDIATRDLATYFRSLEAPVLLV